jgi:hypothetical protein
VDKRGKKEEKVRKKEESSGEKEIRVILVRNER